MPNPVVYNGVRNNQPSREGLFAGQRLWFSSTVPQKSRFIEDVKANGGEVVPLEKQADICLYDHARKNPPPGMYSYRFVEHSVRNGQREDLEAHRIGSLNRRAERPVGSVTLASKGSRNAFTEADDQMLWDWLKPLEGMRGSAGNVIYQQLEAANPRHTFQSWRDRWLKYVQFQKREATRNAQLQHDAAHVVPAPSTPKAKPRETPVSTGSRTSAAPRLAVEVPAEDSPRRKRGRPRKFQRESSNDDTIEVASLNTSEQSQTPTTRTGEDEGVRPQLDKIPTSKTNDDAGSWDFSDEERVSLMDAAEVILRIPREEVGALWERMAESRQEHTSQQWRSYFDDIIVPLYRSQQEKPQKRNGTSGIVDAERNGQNWDADAKAESGEAEQGIGQVAGIYPQPGEQNGNGESEATIEEAQHRQLSPSFEPESPVDWKSETGKFRPGPNESRKRSPAKSNSQECALSKSLSSTVDRAQYLTHTVQTEPLSQENMDDIHSRPAKRRRLSSTEVVVLEIPSTPESTQESETLEDLPGPLTQESETLEDLPGTPNQESDTLEDMPGTPTPRARKRPSHESDLSLPPLFVPPDSNDEDDNLPEQKSQERESNDFETRTSPISVHLVSDHDPPLTSSSSAPHKDAATEPAGSSTPEFETAPDFSQVTHEDVSVSEEEEQDGFKTAAAEQEAAQRTSTPNTQALSNGMTQNEVGSLDFGLPEPEGGWDTIDPDLDLLEEKDEEAVPAPTSPASSTTSTLNLDLDTWVSLRVADGQDMALLLTAAEATNMHKKLADAVYQKLEKGEGIPGDVKGAWTKEDDELLMGTDARGIKGLEGKHGRRSVDERFECLGVWNGVR